MSSLRFSSDRKENFIGKIAAIGQGGSGKSFMVNQLVNFIAKREVYNWDEDKEMTGTLAVTPYSVTFPNKTKVIINDNPGQNSLAKVREAIASMGDVYQGIVVVFDGVAWNFRNIGVIQLQALIKYASDVMPIMVLVSKKDIVLELHYKAYEMAEVIASAVQHIQLNQIISYVNRINMKQAQFELTMSKDIIPFTILEQIIVNALDEWAKFEKMTSFTPMNIRLFTRSLLLGFCDFFKIFSKELADLPEFEAINDDLVNKLNYHRPTALETDANWGYLAGKREDGSPVVSEPPLFTNTLTVETIFSIIKTFVLVEPKEIENFVAEIEKSSNWKITSFGYADSVSAPGKAVILKMFMYLIEEMEKHKIAKERKKEKIKLDVSSLGLDDF